MTEPTLQTLLKQALDALADSGVPMDYRNIESGVRNEEKENPRGLSLNRTTISQILKGTYKKEPTDGTIRAIGWLAGVSDDVAFKAAGRRPPGPPFAAELPAGIDDLTPKERGAVLPLLGALIAQRQEINRYEELLAAATAKSDAQAQAEQGQEAGLQKPKRPPVRRPRGRLHVEGTRKHGTNDADDSH